MIRLDGDLLLGCPYLFDDFLHLDRLDGFTIIFGGVLSHC